MSGIKETAMAQCCQLRYWVIIGLRGNRKDAFRVLRELFGDEIFFDTKIYLFVYINNFMTIMEQNKNIVLKILNRKTVSCNIWFRTQIIIAEAV